MSYTLYESFKYYKNILQRQILKSKNVGSRVVLFTQILLCRFKQKKRCKNYMKTSKTYNYYKFGMSRNMEEKTIVMIKNDFI